MVGTWIGNPLEQSWEYFKTETNNFGILEWEFEEPSKKVNFLDLTISVKNEKISTKTFQKVMNLYQYLSPRSIQPSTWQIKTHTQKTTWTSL